MSAAVHPSCDAASAQCVDRQPAISHPLAIGRHTGSASGFNSAIARTGGLVATAVLGSVLAARGPELPGAFHVAMLAGAMTCLAASASAFLLIEPEVVTSEPG